MESHAKSSIRVRRKFALALAFFAFGIGVLGIPARIFIGDPYTWREEAINLILFQRLDVPAAVAHGHGELNQYFTQNPRTSLWYSKYGIMSGLLNTAPLYFELKFTKRLPPWDSLKRRLYLGYFYAILGAVFTALLFQLCAYYVESVGAALLFVFAAIFCTYLGYYLRATNSEAYQVLFFTAFFERMSAFRAGGFRSYGRLFSAWFFLLCLVLVKVSHLMIVPIVGMLILAFVYRRRRFPEFRRFAILGVVLPSVVIGFSQGLVNFWKFGSPVGTGYTMWQAEAFVHDIPPLQMIRNVLFSEQWGILSHFPLLLLALFGAREFYRRFPFDALLALLVFLAAFVVVGSMPVWKGEWAYGPRYFLFFLPVLSLPALLCFERFLRSEERRKPLVVALLAATVITLVYSGYLQFQVARLDPFFCYWARPNVTEIKDRAVIDYWEKTHFGLIAAQLWRNRENPEELWWMQRLKAELKPQQYEANRQRLVKWLRLTNFYWWSPRD